MKKLFLFLLLILFIFNLEINLVYGAFPYHSPVAFNPGLEDKFKDGIEEGDPSICEAPVGNQCWYVDSEAPEGGTGSFENPYNSFEEVVGTIYGSSYLKGLIEGGDYLYLKGIFKTSDHSEASSYSDLGNSTKLLFGRVTQSGSLENPTVIKSWRGSPRAIFDGEYLDKDLIHLRSLSKEKNANSFKIENIELARAKSRGLYIGENISNLEISNIVIRDTQGDGKIGTGGGILLTMWSGPHYYTFRNNLVYNNDFNHFGVDYNRGGVSFLSEPTANENSTIYIYNNIIHDEANAIRHKHAGFVNSEIFNNLIFNSIRGFWIRSTKNKIHHNLLYNIEEIITPNGENQIGDIRIDFYHNTISNYSSIIETRCGSTEDIRELNLQDNIFTNADLTSDQMIHIYDSGCFDFDPKWIISDSNLFFDFPSTWNKFLYYLGNLYNIEDSLSLISTSGNSLFTDPQLDSNYHPLSTSPVCNSASDGSDIGAFSCSTSFPWNIFIPAMFPKE